MAVKIIEDKIPAKEKLRLGNLFYKSLKDNRQFLSWALTIFLMILFIIITTWNVFTISAQNKLIVKQNDAIATNQVYMASIQTELKYLNRNK